MQRSTTPTPEVCSRRMMCSRIGRSPTGTSGFGRIVVYGRSRKPRPPARTTALRGSLIGRKARRCRVRSGTMANEELVVTRPTARDDRLVGVRRMVIMPAHNEEASVAAVVAEVRAADPAFQIVVVDDGSADHTAELAERAGAIVLRLPFNLGIGGAVQTGYQYALENGFDIAVQVDGDGQHDPGEIGRLLEPILDG